MMYKQIYPEDAVGKTFSKLVFDQRRVLVCFEDETFFQLEARHDYDNEIELEVTNFSINTFSLYTLVENNLITQEEADEISRINRETYYKTELERKLRLFEQLKKELGE